MYTRNIRVIFEKRNGKWNERELAMSRHVSHTFIDDTRVDYRRRTDRTRCNRLTWETNFEIYYFSSRRNSFRRCEIVETPRPHFSHTTVRRPAKRDRTAAAVPNIRCTSICTRDRCTSRDARLIRRYFPPRARGTAFAARVRKSAGTASMRGKTAASDYLAK